jgi:hypothetical protein
VVRDLGSGSLPSTIGRLQFPALIRGPFAQGPDQRRLDARDVFAHQHLRAPGSCARIASGLAAKLKECQIHLIMCESEVPISVAAILPQELQIQSRTQNQ